MQFVGSTEFLPLTARWPLSREGPLPETLIGSDYLEKVFFRALPQEFECPTSAVRKALKVLLKRTAREAHRRLPVKGDLLERDRALAVAACTEPRARERIRELEIAVPVTYSRFGRQRTGYRDRTVDKPLPKLLWLGYSTDPDYESFVDWAKRVGIERPDIGEGFFLTARVLETAFLTAPPPLPVDSVEFARALILFGGLLPAAEALDLFSTASRVGCTPLRALIEFGTELEPESRNGMAGTAMPTPEVTEVAAPNPRPRFVRPDPTTLGPSLIIQVVSDVERMAAQLISSEEQWREAERHAKEAFEPGIGTVVARPEADFQKTVALLEAARKARRTALDNGRSCQQRCDDLTRQAYAKIGFEPPFIEESHHSDLETVAAKLRAADELSHLASHFDTSYPELIAWRNAFDAPPTRSDFERLATLRLSTDESRRARRLFIENVYSFLGQGQSLAEISEWLSELDPFEIATIVQDLDDPLWLVPAAVLARSGLDRDADIFAPHLASALIVARNRAGRRGLIHFCDPASASLDRGPAARRVVAAERLRDILQFGPLAQITDPSAGLSNPEFVGRTMVEIADLITGHLDMLSVGADLRSFVKPQREAEQAVATLVEFSHAPSGMVGNYRRLRERAREKLFLPLVENDRIDHTAIGDLLRRLQSGDAEEQIVNDVREMLGRGDNIEARHRTHLHRYLRRGREILEDILAELALRTSQRERDFRQQLMLHLKELRTDGEIGSSGWFENEVREMLLGVAPPSDHPTLVGDATPIDVRVWRTEDSLWAQSILNLPEFYLDERLGTIEVAAAALRWRGRGRAPNLCDIVGELVEKRYFGIALSAIEEAADDPGVKAELRNFVVNEAQPAIEAARLRLSAIRERFGDAALGRSSIRASVETALDAFDPDDAMEQCDLLELELSEAEQSPTPELVDPAIQARRDALVKLLLLAGVVGIDERSPLNDLEARWSDELHRRQGERIHISIVEDSFSTVEKSLPAISDEFLRFRQQNLRADRWLPAPLAKNLVVCLEGAASRLNVWITSALTFEEEGRQALVDFAIWFMRFVAEQTETLRSLAPGDSNDAVFDRVIEMSDCVLKASDPITCLRLLDEISPWCWRPIPLWALPRLPN
jgi:hypothetical protein